MNRKEFFQRGIAAALAAGTAPAWMRYAEAFAGTAAAQSAYDLVAVKGGEPDLMLDKAMEAMGGMKNFVPKGSKVVVKPNIGWDVPPERGANTNPKLVAQVIKHCFAAGAKQVTVFDHTCDDWKGCYANSGIERAARDAGARVVPGNTESYYQKVTLSNTKRMPNSKVHELILDADVFINVPVLKNHGSAKLTVTMKNLMGIVWDRGEMHRNDLHQCIADLAAFKKPTLNIVDAYTVMKKNGPRGVSQEDIVTMKSLLVSTDMVASDAAATKLFGWEPADIRHIKIASEQGLGRIDLQSLNIKRISL
ncbi:MAG: DUF362 domain-containing protein [Acidobacteriota bacterium]